MSVSDGFGKTAKKALDIGANTFQYFTRNPRGGRAREIKNEEIDLLKKIMKENEFAPLFAHAAYTMNLASNKSHVREFARQLFEDDLKRIEKISNSFYIFHPGSHVGQGNEKGIELVVDALNDLIPENNKTVILLETMSGKGTELGRNMDELKSIIDNVDQNKNLGICLDTCHVYSSGHDIVNDLDGVLEEIDEKLGIDRLKAIHLNDSMMEFNSNKDRHAALGEGTIGMDAIINIINHPGLKNLPFNLETPNELDGYEEEIKTLREARK